MILLLFSRNSSAQNLADNNKGTLLIIHSYAMDYEWTESEDKGIEQVIKENHHIFKNWRIEKIFLAGKRKSENLSKEFISSLKEKIINFEPAAVMLTDDLAVKVFYKFLNENHIHIGFTGVNGNMEDYGYTSKHTHTTGLLERHNIVPAVQIIKKLRPSINRVLVVSDPSVTGSNTLQDFKNQLTSNLSIIGISFIEQFVSNDYDELKNKLNDVDSEHTLVVFAAFYTYKENNRRFVDYREINDWVERNTNFLDVGAADFNVKRGRLLSVACSGFDVGYTGAKMLLDYIANGNKLAKEPIQRNLPSQLVINYEKAKKLGLHIPYEILAYTSNMNEYLR